MIVTAAQLCTIRVLYRGADSMDLWGIPYGMRPGQGPKDILDRYRDAWIWLGSPGWFGAMDPASIERVKAFVASCGPDVPCGPYEWCYIAPPPEGARVRLRRNVERFPHFIAPAGAAGVVSFVGAGPGGSVCVKLDAPLAGAEEWDNEVVWTEDDLAALASDLEVLQ